MTASLMSTEVLNELCGDGLAPNDGLLDPMDVLSELYGYRMAPNDWHLDANGNAQRPLFLTGWPQLTACVMPM